MLSGIILCAGRGLDKELKVYRWYGVMMVIGSISRVSFAAQGAGQDFSKISVQRGAKIISDIALLPDALGSMIAEYARYGYRKILINDLFNTNYTGTSAPLNIQYMHILTQRNGCLYLKQWRVYNEKSTDSSRSIETSQIMEQYARDHWGWERCSLEHCSINLWGSLPSEAFFKWLGFDPAVVYFFNYLLKQCTIQCLPFDSAEYSNCSQRCGVICSEEVTDVCIVTMMKRICNKFQKYVSKGKAVPFNGFMNGYRKAYRKSHIPKMLEEASNKGMVFMGKNNKARLDQERKREEAERKRDRQVWFDHFYGDGDFEESE